MLKSSRAIQDFKFKFRHDFKLELRSLFVSPPPGAPFSEVEFMFVTNSNSNLWLNAKLWHNEEWEQ